jgi:hypothetical protein
MNSRLLDFLVFLLVWVLYGDLFDFSSDFSSFLFQVFLFLPLMSWNRPLGIILVNTYTIDLKLGSCSYDHLH